MRVAPAHGFQPRSCNANAYGLGSSSIIVRMSAIRTPAVAATDNGRPAPELAAGMPKRSRPPADITTTKGTPARGGGGHNGRCSGGFTLLATVAARFCASGG
jgi:hypothetical protein